MGNIDINKIRKKGFKKGSKEEKIEEYCRKMVSEHTSKILDEYSKLPSSRCGRYINLDLMKMTFPFYANNIENRKLYNMSITNSAAVLANEAYVRKIANKDTKRSLFVTGPYGAGKSYFVQTLFESDEEENLTDSIVYEGSITPPAFEEKIQYAIDNGITPHIIAINPTLELSVKNIQERFARIGRNVEKKEVIDKFSNFYTYMKQIIEKFETITYVIYNKESNLPENTRISRNIEDLYHGTEQEIEEKYDRIIKLSNKEH